MVLIPRSFKAVKKLVSHQTVSRLQSSPNIQSGKYNEMDPILIGTAVSEHVIKEMSKPVVPLVKALWRTIILSIFIITSWLIIINVVVVERRKQEITASSLMYRNIPQNALSLLDNSLNIHHFGMGKVVWLSWRSWLYSGTKFAPWSLIFLKNFEVKLAASASKFRPKTDKVIGVQATYKHTVVHNEPTKYHKF